MTGVSREKTARAYAPGRLVKGQGVYLGRWQPRYASGRRLGKTFDVFAAPEDLPRAAGGRIVLPFNVAARRVEKLKSWHGHDGSYHLSDATLRRARKNGSHGGKWFIPPLDLLRQIHENRNKGAFRGGFSAPTVSEGLAGIYPSRYWSSTPDRLDPAFRAAVEFPNGRAGCASRVRRKYSKNGPDRLSCRPVRVVEISG